MGEGLGSPAETTEQTKTRNPWHRAESTGIPEAVFGKTRPTSQESRQGGGSPRPAEAVTHCATLQWGWETGTSKALCQLPPRGKRNDKMRALIAEQRRVIPSSPHPIRMFCAAVSGWSVCQQALQRHCPCMGTVCWQRNYVFHALISCSHSFTCLAC